MLSVNRWLLHLVRIVDKIAVVSDSLSDARQTQTPIGDRQQAGGVLSSELATLLAKRGAL
jgi:hypothetical protein